MPDRCQCRHAVVTLTALVVVLSLGFIAPDADAPVLPEALSGCRKSPIFVVGINPNLTGFSKTRKNSVYPLFDEYKQFAHYFRYRSTEKLEIPDAAFEGFGGDNAEVPPDLATDLNVPLTNGKKTVPLQMQLVKYYDELRKNKCFGINKSK